MQLIVTVFIHFILFVFVCFGCIVISICVIFKYGIFIRREVFSDGGFVIGCVCRSIRLVFVIVIRRVRGEFSRGLIFGFFIICDRELLSLCVRHLLFVSCAIS